MTIQSSCASAHTPTPSTDIGALQNAILAVDSLARSTPGGIASIADLARLALESPDGHRSPENLARVLTVICNLAMDAQDCIASEAEAVNCYAEDGQEARRRDAYREAIHRFNALPCADGRKQ